MSADRAASGVLEIAAWSQANAVRQVSTRRGLDVRDYVLVAFGGSGPLQAGRLVDLLGLSGALIPPSPGNVSAFGLLTVDLKNDYVQTLVQRDDRLDLEGVAEVYVRLEAEARAALEREAAPNGYLQRSADLRYFGQSSEVRVDVSGGDFDRASADEAVQRFHAAHERTYGYSYVASQPPQAVEWVNLRVTGVAPIHRPALRTRPPGLSGSTERALVEHRGVHFDAGWLETPIFAREHLQPGDCINGPAVIQEFGSTTVVPPQLQASVDGFGNLLLKKAA
jgi:N-methylhydantoinase A